MVNESQTEESRTKNQNIAFNCDFLAMNLLVPEARMGLPKEDNEMNFKPTHHHRKCSSWPKLPLSRVAEA